MPGFKCTKYIGRNPSSVVMRNRTHRAVKQQRRIENLMELNVTGKKVAVLAAKSVDYNTVPQHLQQVSPMYSFPHHVHLIQYTRQVHVHVKL